MISQFEVQLQASMQKFAGESSDKLISLDNNYDDATTLQNAQTLMNDKVNVVVNFTIDAPITPKLAQVFGSTKVISLEAPETGAVYFGQNNYQDGLGVGLALGKYAKSHSWSPARTYLVLLNDPATGATIESRMTGMQDGVMTAFPGIPRGQVLTQNGQAQLATGQSVTASLLPKIPTGDHIILAGLEDESTLGGLRAIQKAGRESEVIAGSQGGSSVSIDELETDPHWVAEMAYFPEFYGKYIFQLISDFKAGTAVAPYNFPPTVLLTASNVTTYYPHKATTAVQPPPGNVTSSQTAPPLAK